MTQSVARFADEEWPNLLLLIADFLMWKEDYEMMNSSQYRLTSSKFQSMCRYFNCSRSGFYNPKEDKKRKAKSQGTSKMNGHCISGMVVKTDEYGAVSIWSYLFILTLLFLVYCGSALCVFASSCCSRSISWFPGEVQVLVLLHWLLRRMKLWTG